MIQNTSFQNAIARIWNLLRLDKRDIYAIYVFSILAGIVSLSLPLGIQSIVGFLMAGAYSTSIIVLVVLVVLGTFMNGLLQVKQLQLIEKVEQKIFVRYALEFSDRIPKLNLEILNKYFLPELLNRFFDLPILQKSLQKLLIEIPPAIFQVLLGTILLSFYHPLFIAFGFFLLFSVFLIIRFTSRAGFQTSMQASTYKYNLAGWFQDLARNINVFKYGKNTKVNLNVADDLIRKYLDTKTKHFGILSIQYYSLIAFKLLITGAMLVFGVILVIEQKINIGQFIASDIVILMIINSIEKLIGSMEHIYEALTAVEKLDVVGNAPIEDSGSLKMENVEESLGIEAKNLKYSLGEDLEIFQDINFKLEPGQWLNVNGSFGSGKSLFLHILAGTYPSFKGQLLINDIPIKNYDLAWYRSQLGIFIAKQDIFKGSLWQNISLDNVNCNAKQVIHLCKLIGLQEFISTCPEGLETQVEFSGKGVSNKVKHQIVLIRALAIPSKVYVLDEPFLFLSDSQKENLIIYLKQTKATVVITSQAPMEFCDVFLNLDQKSHE
jgi:ATP-binding cassette, subfamily B, bacterial